MLDKIDGSVRASGYQGKPIRMYLAGGLAVNYYCGSRYTEDVDATFSRRVLLPFKDLVVDYVKSDNTASVIYFDANYNNALCLLHEDYEEDVVEFEGIGNAARAVHLYLLSPVDLAVSKVSRFSEQDRDDILALASFGYFTADELGRRALEALDYYVGDTRTVRTSIAIICDRIRAAKPGGARDRPP